MSAQNFFSALGFSPDGVKRILTRMDPEVTHLTRMDWAYMYLEDIFNYRHEAYNSLFPFGDPNGPKSFTVSGNPLGRTTLKF